MTRQTELIFKFYVNFFRNITKFGIIYAYIFGDNYELKN